MGMVDIFSSRSTVLRVGDRLKTAGTQPTMIENLLQVQRGFGWSEAQSIARV